MSAALRFLLRASLASACIWLLAFPAKRSTDYVAAEFHAFQAEQLTGFERYLELQAAVDAVPEAYDTAWTLGWAEWNLGRYRVAESLWTAAVQLRPTQPQPWDALGRHLAREGPQSRTAETYLQWSLKLGANERDLILERAWLAIDLWPGAPGSWQSRLFPQFVERALETEPLRVQAYAFVQRRESVLCTSPSSFSAQAKDLPDWCVKVEEHRKLCEGVLAHVRRVEDWCRQADEYWRAAL